MANRQIEKCQSMNLRERKKNDFQNKLSIFEFQAHSQQAVGKESMKAS